jgi:protein SCO1/2
VTGEAVGKDKHDEESPGYWRRRLSRRAGLLALCLAGVMGLAYYARQHQPLPALADYGHVPAFKLVDQRSAPFTDASLLGHVSVVDFIFTRCAASCPRLTKQMADLQGRLPREGSSARLVSFSVDPENDTPPVLAEYATHAGADPLRWSFVTGPIDDVKAVVVSGFKVALQKLPNVKNGTSDYDVTHGDWFVLVDPKGDVRGYYTTDEPANVDRLVRDALRLEHGGA